MADGKQMEEVVEMNSPKSWDYARSYASLFGDIPSSFSSTMRTLMLDNEKLAGSISNGGRFLALRLLKGKNLKAPYYFACLTYKPDLFEGKTTLKDSDLLAGFKPDEVAALFGIIYLFKKAKKFCDPTELEFFLPNFYRDIEIAGHVGASIPAIGLCNSLFSVALRYLGVMAYLRHNIKHFQEYRRLLKAKNTIFSFPDQMNYFGCLDVQIGSIFLQSLGFGVNFSSQFHMCLSKDRLLEKTEVTSSPFEVVKLWIHSLVETGKIPEIVHDIKFYPKKDNVDPLVARISECVSKGSKYTWLEKGKDDINPTTTPQLCDESQDKEIEAVPDEIRAEVSKDDLAALEKETDI